MMISIRVRFLYAVAGGFFGAVAAAIVGYCAFFMGMSVCWLFIFGDSGWPAHTLTIIALIAVGAALSSLGLCVVRGYFYGKSVENQKSADPAAENKKALWVLVISIVFFASVTAAAFSYVVHFKKSAKIHSQAVQAQVSHTNAFLENRLKIFSVEAVLRTDLSGYDVTVRMAGRRSGRYTMSLIVEEMLYHRKLLNTRETAEMGPETTRHYFVDYDKLIQAYHEQVFQRKPVRVRVQENFRLSVSLSPVLSDQERTSPGIADVKTCPLPAHFTIQGTTIHKSEHPDRTQSFHSE